MADLRKEKQPSETSNLTVSWHALSTDDVIRELNTDIPTGLSSEEAAQRFKKYGPNRLAEKPRPGFLKMVIDQLNNFIIILLIIAAIISLVLGEYLDAAAIFAIVILNAVMGVIQESRAEAALAALQKLAAPEAQVIRDGHRVSIPAPELVPGDVVLLEAGNFVPADLRLLEAVNLRVEEAALTGESVPVQKNAGLRLETDVPLGDRKNTVFMGTTINYGRGRGVVVATGMRTQLGLIADMLQSVESEDTPLQQRLDQLGKLLGYGALVVCGLVFIVGLFRAYQAFGVQQLFQTTTGIQEMIDLFMIAVSLAIAAVPEGLPAVVTISLALGMREMVRRHVLIRKLASVETLGSATVICSDKTGTLTQNEMTITHLWVDGKTFEVPGSGPSTGGAFLLDGREVDLRQYPGASTVLWVGVLNNDAQLETFPGADGKPAYRMVGDPTEGSILVAAAKAGAYAADLNRAYPRQDEIPFDATRKRMVTIHQVSGQKDEDISPLYGEPNEPVFAITVKGAPDVVLNLCAYYQTANDKVRPLDDATLQKILAANDQMTRQALRVLGLAYRLVPQAPAEMEAREVENELVFAGMVGMIDPARPEVAPALQTAKNAGIRTIMITGDYPNTARAIAERIELLAPGHKVMTGAELNAIGDEALKREVEVTDVFARVSPEHKMRIVDALRANDEVVAMTGDGVNDAPAIKRADIGVAMGITGTDVAKETADMVLTDDNYVSIVAAIEQGRVIYSNIRKFVFFLLSSNIAEVMIIFLATLAGLPSPLTAIQLLWLNLLTDGAPALALAMEKGDPDVMENPPRPKREPIINGSMRTGIVIQTFAQAGAVLTAFLIGLYHQVGSGIPVGENPLLYLLRFDWRTTEILVPETMAFVTLSLCELFRAYTVRSEHISVFRLGLFSNKYMQYGVALSILLLLLVVNVPFLQPVFNTTFLALNEWLLVLGLALIPAVAEEITKWVLSMRHARI
jgi:P-type Ca2+ transporter type 2C